MSQKDQSDKLRNELAKIFAGAKGIKTNKDKFDGFVAGWNARGTEIKELETKLEIMIEALEEELDIK